MRNQTETRHDTFDAIVIGAGSAGLAFSRKAAALGARILMVEHNKVGGTCVNRGCVPKKLLWHRAWDMEQARAAGRAPETDLAALQTSIADKTETIRNGFHDDLSEVGVSLLRGTAVLSEPGEVTVDGKSYRARYVVLASGARPMQPDFPGADLAVTSEDVLGWKDVPGDILFLGAGYIGCELASIFTGFGARTALVDPGLRILDTFSKDLAEAAKAILKARGIGLHLGSTPQKIERTPNGLRTVLDTGETLDSEVVVAAVGRTPNIDSLGPIAERLKIADSGALAISDRFETSEPGVYAIGDVADRLPLTPVATRDGDVVANLLFGDGSASPIDLGLVASAAFVMPPIAEVGKVDDSDPTTGEDLIDGVYTPDGHWSVRTVNRLTCNDSGDPMGVSLMGAAAADMIAPFAALIASTRHQNSTTAATGVHPTFGQETVGR